MGNYNVHSPVILGNEWVPIRESSYAVDAQTELGYRFHLDHSAPVVSGSFYVEQNTPNIGNRVVDMAVYQAGQEHLTGPIHKVVIPVTAVGTSGTTGTATAVGAPSLVDALRESGDSGYIQMFGDVRLYMSFDTASFSTQLDNKRILNVSVLYALSGATPSNLNLIAMYLVNNSTSSPANSFGYGAPNVHASSPGLIPQIERLSLGSSLPFLTTDFWFNSSQRYPWRYEDLARFASGAGTPLSILLWSDHFNSIADEPRLYASYMALEVTYCEENRLMVGGVYGSFFNVFRTGRNAVPLRTADSTTSGRTLTPGDYTVAVTLGELTEVQTGDAPRVNRLRELFAGSGQTAVEITHSLRENTTFSVREINEFPAIALHTSSRVVTGCHAYTDQFGAPVYDSVNATQEIHAARAPANATEYPQVRFYARRFGETNVDLTLTGVNDANSATVSISPLEFDALPEIIDGWREVTLRFPDDAIPTFSSSDGQPDWRWSATGLSVANQWQVLAMDSRDATSGPLVGDAATYGAPIGSTVELTHSGSSDTSADAVIIFSQDPPLVTGFAITEETQDLVAVDPECSIAPECIPTGITYHQLTWDPFVIYDNFTEVVADDWGSTTTGQDWSHFGAGGTAASDFQKTGTVGTMSVSQDNAYRVSYLAGVSLLDVEVFVEGSIEEDLITSNSIEPVAALTRITSTTDYYMARVTATNTELLTIAIYNPNDVQLATATVPNVQHNGGQRIKLRMQSFGTMHRARVWVVGMAEPTIWHVTANDTVGMTAGGVGVRVGVESGNLETKPIVASYYSFIAAPMSVVGGYLEIQRQDDTQDDDEWDTIAHVSDWTTTTFNDYEARVDVVSRYRARVLNILDFAGSWTSEVERTLASPGVTGIGSTGNSVLLFTTNERQDGSSNLAYVQTWESNVSEDFTFPEASAVQLQELYGRDYVVAFRPTERGGERFSRSILVNNAAVSSGRITEGFRSLRNMAWDNVSYVCVRNELGDRWLANVQVPNGKIQRNRRLYIAQINVIETTDTPSVVEVAEE